MASFDEIEQHLVALATDAHPVGRCNLCGAPTLIKADNTPPCRLTPGCEGKHLVAGRRAKKKRAAA